MGVAGLSQYLRDNASYQLIELQRESPTESSSQPTLVLVLDGMSVCHFLRRSCKRNPCCYYLEIFRKEVEHFLAVLKQYHVHIASAVFDGAFDSNKDSTRKSRRSTRDTNLKYVVGALDTAQKEKELGLVTPAGTLASLNGCVDSTSISPFREVFIQELKANSVEVIVAPFEGDNLTAAVCRQYAGSAVLADDSDYFILGVPLASLSSLSYVPLNCVGSETMSTEASSSTDIADDSTLTSPPDDPLLRLHLYTPERVLQCLKLPEKLLPYLSTLAGNDYSDFELTMKFAKSAGFASVARSSVQRVAKIVAWLQKTQDVDTSLKRIFKKYKGPIDFNTALNQTIRATAAVAEIPSTFPPVFPGHDDDSNENYLRLWGLHKCASVSPLVLGVLLKRKYWVPVVGNEKLTGLLQPLREVFYRSLFRLFPSVADTTAPVVIEIGVAQQHKVSVDTSLALSLPLRAILDSAPAASLAQLLECLDIQARYINSIAPFVLTQPTTAHILATLHYIQAHKGDASKLASAHLQGLLQQHLLLQQNDWFDRIRGLPSKLMPSPDTTETSVTFVITLGWIRLLNVLCGEPLGHLSDRYCLFDGLLFALCLSIHRNCASMQMEIPPEIEAAWRTLSDN